MTPARTAATACAAAALLLVAAPSCAGGEEGASAGGAPAVSLRITYSYNGRRQFAAGVECHGARQRLTGFLFRRSPAAVCSAARRLAGFLATPPDHTRQCTQVYGGPDRGRVRGTIGARRVDRAFARRNGCEIYDWTQARLLLARPRGVVPAPA